MNVAAAYAPSAIQPASVRSPPTTRSPRRCWATTRTRCPHLTVPAGIPPALSSTTIWSEDEHHKQHAGNPRGASSFDRTLRLGPADHVEPAGGRQLEQRRVGPRTGGRAASTGHRPTDPRRGADRSGAEDVLRRSGSQSP